VAVNGRGGPSRDWVAIILAIGLATAINMITFAAMWDALFHSEPGLSENSTNLLTAVLGGLIGVLGSFLGYRVGERAGRTAGTPPD
jgi:hypothetical protein